MNDTCQVLMQIERVTNTMVASEAHKHQLFKWELPWLSCGSWSSNFLINFKAELTWPIFKSIKNCNKYAVAVGVMYATTPTKTCLQKYSITNQFNIIQTFITTQHSTYFFRCISTLPLLDVRLITKSCRVWYRKLIVNNVRKAVFLVSYELSIFEKSQHLLFFHSNLKSLWMYPINL